MMKALRAQSKAGAASKLARMGKFAKGGKANDGDADDKPAAKAKKTLLMMVDGKPARARLDRPGRRMKHAEGGPAWQGEGDSGKAMKEKSAVEDAQALSKVKRGSVISALGGAMTGWNRSPLGKLIGVGTGLAGVSDIGEGLAQSTKARRLNEAADKQEGRKDGGRAKR